METELEVLIQGGSPWGFSLTGGAEYGEPLTVHKIEAGGKADIAGQKRLKVGDEVLYINKTFCNTRLHAVQLVKSASKTLNLQVKRRESQADIVPPPPTEEPKTVPAQEKGSMHTESVTKVVQPSGFGGVKHRVKKRHDPPERPRSWHSTHEAINSHPDVVPDFEPMPVSSNQARYSQQRRDRAASSFDSTGRESSMFHGSSMENMSKSSFVCAQYQPPASAGFPKKSGSVYDQLSSTAGINYKDSLSTKKPEEEEHSYPRSQSLTNMKAKELQHADMRYVKTMYVPGTRPKEEDAVFWPTSTSPSERKRNRSSGSSSDFQGGSNRNSLGVDIPAPPWRRSSTSPSSSSSSTTSPQLGPQSARSPPPPPVRDQSSHKAVSNMVHHSKYPSWPGPSSMLAPEPHAMSKSHDNPLRMLSNPPTGHQRSPDYVNQEVFSHYNDQRGNHAGNGKRGSHGDQWGSFSQPSDHQRPYPQLTAVVHPVQPVQPSFADTVEIGQNGTYKVQKEGGKEMEKVEFRVQINMDGTPRYPSDRRVPSPPERDLSPEKQVSPAAKQLSPTSSSRDQNLNYINNLQKKSPKYEDSGFYYEEKPTEGTVAAHNYRNERERQQGPNQWYNNKSNNHYSREFKHTEPPDHDKQKLTREVGKPDPRHSSLSGHHSSSTENVTREEGGQKTAVQLLRSQFEDPLKTRSILRTETVNFGQPGGLPGGVKKISRAQSERNLEPKWVRDMRKERSMRNVNGGINHQDTPLIFNLFKEGKKDQDAKLKERRASSEMLAMHAKKSATLPDNLRYNPPTFDYWRQMEKEQTQQKSKKSDQGGRTDDQKVRMQDEDGYKNYLKEAQDKVLHRTSYTKTEFEHVRQRSGGSWRSGSAENLLDIGERSPSQHSPTSPTWSTGEPAKRKSGSADNLLDVVDTRVSPTRRSPTHSVSMEQLHTPVEPKETVVREARESPISPSQSLAQLEEIKETEEHPEERKSRTVSDPQKRTKSVSAGHLRRHHAAEWEAKRQQCKSEPDLLHQEDKGPQTLDNQYGGSVTSLSSEHRSDPDGREEERMRMREALKWFYEKKTGNKVINRGVSTSSINSDSGYTSNRNSLASQRAASVSSLEGSRVQTPVEGTRKPRPSSGHVRDPVSQQARDKAQSLPRMPGPPNFQGLQTMPIPGGKEMGRPAAPVPWKDRKASAPAHLHQTIADFRPASPSKTGRAMSVDSSDGRPMRPHHGIPMLKPTPSPTETKEVDRNMSSPHDRLPGDRSSKESSPSSAEERERRVLPKEGDRRKEASPPYQEGRLRKVTAKEESHVSPTSATEDENSAKHHPPREEKQSPVSEERVQGQEPVQNAPQVEVKQRPTKETVVTITLQQKQQKPLPPVPEKEVLPNGVPEDGGDNDSIFVFPDAEPTPSDRKLSNGSSGSDVFIEDSTSLRHKEALVAAKSPTRSWEEKKSVNGVHEARVRKISPLKEEPLPPPPPSPPPAEPEPPTMEFLDFLPPPPPELLHDEEAGVDMESPPPPPPVEDSPRQDNHRHHSPATASPEHISPSRPHPKAMPPRTVSPSEISSPTDSSGSKTPSPPSSEHSRSSSRSSSEKSGSSDSHTVPTRDSSPSIGSSVSSLKDESERTRQPSGEKRISISPIHIRQKTPEEIKTDELAKDIIDRCDDKNLKEILMEPNHKTADYMRECFPEAVQPLQPSERRRSSAASVRGKSGEGKTSQPLKTRSLSETQLPPTSPYFTESSAKAKMMLEMRRQQEEEAEAVEEEEDQEVLDQKKMELIDSISKKLENLRKAEDLIREEIDLNNELGQQVTEWAKEMTKSNEFDKYQRFVDELDKITNLLLSLSGRLARAQNALQNIEEGTDPAEKRELQDKRDRLSDQYDDAKKLKENIDNRKDAVSKILTEYFNEEQFADFEHFIKMKSQLIMESRELDDKIKLGEEQLRCLRENLSMDT
ncbi:protein Shroom3-like isoform X2 [Branchiostoma floridae]|uniref:Protein Shroom3-like isoform X2 n=1 Tax=Branchiostoma floridae TaxID=7739 RepID=A0A9J7MY03_BRAFL|nr:protein Shroom3-like isoform X2 [Branchiostoma floridae]